MSAEPVVKVCGCGCKYTAAEWERLERVGEMVDDVEAIELRNCSACVSTLAIVLHEMAVAS